MLLIDQRRNVCFCAVSCTPRSVAIVRSASEEGLQYFEIVPEDGNARNYSVHVHVDKPAMPVVSDSDTRLQP